jgi:hypothetical protein
MATPKPYSPPNTRRSKSGDEMWNQVQPELSMKFETFQNYDPAQSVLISEWNSIAEVLRNGELHEREFVLKKKASTEVSPLVQSRRACNLLFLCCRCGSISQSPRLVIAPWSLAPLDHSLLGRCTHTTVHLDHFYFFQNEAQDDCSQTQTNRRLDSAPERGRS